LKKCLDLNTDLLTVSVVQFTEGWDNTISNDFVVVQFLDELLVLVVLLLVVVEIVQSTEGEWSGFEITFTGQEWSFNFPLDQFPAGQEWAGFQITGQFTGHEWSRFQITGHEWLEFSLTGQEWSFDLVDEGDIFVFTEVLADNFLNVGEGKSLQDGVKFIRDFLRDDELLEENVFDQNFTFDFRNSLLLGDNLLVNLDIDNLGFLDDNLGFTGDWLNNKFLMGRGDLDVSLDLGDLSLDWFVEEESSVDFVQKEFVVDWSVDITVLVGITGGVWDGVVSVSSLLVSVLEGFEDFVQVVSDNDFTGFDIPVQIFIDKLLLLSEGVSSLEGVGWVFVFEDTFLGLGEDLDLWDDVFVEENWVTEVLLELLELPQVLEHWGFNVPSEDDWVLSQVLTEQRNLVVSLEEVGLDKLFEGVDGHTTLIPAVYILSPFQTGFQTQKRFLGELESVVEVLLEEFVLQQRLLLEETKSVDVDIQVAGCDAGNKCQTDESFHDERS